VEQINYVLRQAEGGTSVEDGSRQLCFSEARFHLHGSLDDLTPSEFVSKRQECGPLEAATL
jgi:hypothetical protein